MYGRSSKFIRFIGAGLLLGSSVGCSGGDGTGDGEPSVPQQGTSATLLRAESCDDLLTKIQDDAIAKLKMTIERAKAQGTMLHGAGKDAAIGAVPPTTANAGTTGGVGSAPARDDGDLASDGAAESSNAGSSSNPVGSSSTNTQVADVDEADFVKVVENGRGIFLLHGNQLLKLKSWPAAETALVGAPAKIEGSPSEMFVTDEGKAVVFSSVGSYGGKAVPVASSGAGVAADVACSPEGCGGYGTTELKITVIDVSKDVPVVERELYYEGWYVSSRRYAKGESEVVRAVIQANSKYSGLFEPQISWYDAWGRAYDDENIADQLAEWERRTTASIRKTTLEDWLPSAFEQKNGQREKMAPACGDYFVPVAGLSDYGLTHVVSLDVATPGQKVGGVTIVGGTSTVYSNTKQLVLAQPDYRWSSSMDFGVANGQQTALHLFDLDGATTAYRASGWVPGNLPLRNPQFGLDVASDGTIRVATTGAVRNQSSAKATEPAFWSSHTESYVLTVRLGEGGLGIVGKSEKLGHDGESVYSARFVGDRGYVVTFRQTDPLIVLDLKNPATPTVLGEIEIPGFSEYMHPLDANHLITVGQSATRSLQLQLFDVTNPAALPAPKVLDLGNGSSSAVSYEHKAFTFFEGVLAMPLSGYRNDLRGGYVSRLLLARVDATNGFTKLGEVDHAPLYADNGYGVKCGYCDGVGCYEYACSYAPEVRRGHFVKGESTTYVYSFSYAGVLVNDLANLAQPIAKVGLPAPQFSAYPGSVSDGGAAVGPTASAAEPVQTSSSAADAGAAMSLE